MTIVASTCQGCGVYCSVLVEEEGGEPLSVRGNPANLATGGAVCPALQITLSQRNDPDRVLTPLKRRNPVKDRREDPRFEPISWDDALNEIADRMIRLRESGNAHKLVITKGRSTGISDVLFKALPDIYGTPNRVAHDTICAEAEKLATASLDGVWDYRDYDLERAECIILWGTDPLVANRQKSQMLGSFSALKAHAAVYAVSPHRSYTAEKAGEGSWVPIIPGTDGALALAIAHVMLRDGLWNESFVGSFRGGVNLFAEGRAVDASTFVEASTAGVVEWWNSELRFRTPAWAQPLCGVDAARIEEIAHAFGAAGSRAISWVSPGVTMAARGVASGMACYALNGLAGSVDALGGVLRFPALELAPIPDTDPYQDDSAQAGCRREPIDGRARRGTMVAQANRIHKNHFTNGLADSILADNPYSAEMMIGYWNNFAFSCTETSRWEDALAKLPFFVHVTTHISETTHFADIVLPSAHHLFKSWGFVKSRMRGRSCVTLMQPSVPPLGEARGDEAEFPFMLAEKLAERGFTALRDYYKREFADFETGLQPSCGADLSRNAVKLMTRPAWELAGGWDEFCMKGAICSERAEGLEDGASRSFNTPSGCFEFVSGILTGMVGDYAALHGITPGEAVEELGYSCPGIIGMPYWEEPCRVGAPDEFPLVFSQHRAFASLEGRSANSPLFQDLKKMDPGDEPWDDVVKLHPEDMRRFGLESGQEARLVSPIGSITVKAKAWDGVLPGVASKCYGQGHWAYGRVAALDFERRIPRGGNANEITPCVYEGFSGSTARHGGVMRVRAEPV